MTVWISVFAIEGNDTWIPPGNGSYVDFEAFFVELHVKTLGCTWQIFSQNTRQDV